jgi:hypothetical protein
MIMAFNRRYRREDQRSKTSSCSCGGEAKLTSRKNYPFGKKSGSVTSWFYKCKSCGKCIYSNKVSGGKK